MTYTPKAQRLMKLAQRAGELEVAAYDAGCRERAYHFMQKMNRLTKLAIHAQHCAGGDK